MRADRTHRAYRSPARTLSKPRCTPDPNCGSLVGEGISEGPRTASQAASASTFVSSASGRTASAPPSKSLFSTRRASRGDRAGWPRRGGHERGQGSGYDGFALHSVRIDRHPRSPFAAPCGALALARGEVRQPESSGKRLRAALAAITGPHDDKATPVLHLDAPSHDVSSPRKRGSSRGTRRSADISREVDESDEKRQAS